jgi:hypothetical protein
MELLDRSGRSGGSGGSGRVARLGQGAGGHAAPRAWESEARHLRQLAAGEGPPPLRKVAFAIALILAAASSRPSGQPAVPTLAVAGRANAHVSLASHDRFIVATWAASLESGETDVFAAVSRDAGASFAAPVRVNSTPGDARVNGEQPPRAVLTRGTADPSITVIWTSKGANGTTLLTAVSSDGGRTFGRSRLMPGTDAPGNRGWQSLAAGAGGVVHAAWLDHRELAESESKRAPHQHAGHGASASPADLTDGVAMAARSKLYITTLGSAPMAITGGVCYCCKTALVTGRSGEVFAAWRHVYDGNIRDIAFASSRDGGKTFTAPIRVSEDQWQLNGCPDDGPAMAIDASDRVHVVWPTIFTERGEPTLALYYSMSADGKRFSPRMRLPTEGVAHHPQAAVANDGSLVVVWDETIDRSRRIVMALGSAGDGGAVRFERLTVEQGESGVYPAVVPVGAGALVAWTSGPAPASVIRVVRKGRLS